jgi:hypothetical protein
LNKVVKTVELERFIHEIAAPGEAQRPKLAAVHQTQHHVVVELSGKNVIRCKIIMNKWVVNIYVTRYTDGQDQGEGTLPPLPASLPEPGSYNDMERILPNSHSPLTLAC